MLIRYVLSELLVLGEGDRRQIPQRIGDLINSISTIGQDRAKPKVAQKAANIDHIDAEIAVASAREPGRNRRSDATIQQIVTAAGEIILQSGVERISILAVCEAAGISRGTFYRYFSSQDALLEAYTESQRKQFHLALIEVAAPHEDPEARFNAVITNLDRFLQQDKSRRLLLVAPEYAFGFFQRMFDDAIARFKSVLDMVFDAWDARLAIQIDRDLACELLVRYILSELLVPSEIDKRLLPLRLRGMIQTVVVARGR
ncbi:TetR/AcrR family transcriptional regulator [Glaciimonas sp. PCH181]|nr:TetR/AcrR family transcriptional regulator [Glaciimonas sp. PCH181]